VWREAHEEGAVLHVRVLRESGQVTVMVRVGRICIE
jgi:hypothetical protein